MKKQDHWVVGGVVFLAILVMGQLALLAYRSGPGASENSAKNANLIILLMAGGISGVGVLAAMKLSPDLAGKDPIAPSGQDPVNNLERLKMLGATRRDQALTIALYEVGQGATLADANEFLRPYTEGAQQPLRIGPKPDEEILGGFTNPHANSHRPEVPAHRRPSSVGAIDLRASLDAERNGEPDVDDDLWTAAPAPAPAPDSDPGFVIAGVEL